MLTAYIIQVIFIFTAISIATPIFLAALVPLSVFYYFIYVYYSMPITFAKINEFSDFGSFDIAAATASGRCDSFAYLCQLQRDIKRSVNHSSV